MGSNMIMIRPGQDRGPGGARQDASEMQTLKLKDYELLKENCRYLAAISPSVSSSGQFVAGNNKYGYPNSSGYDKKELEKWDGFNEVSVYGISEAGTTATLADGTKITNDWSDDVMAIACEGLQNKLFAES